MVAGADQFNADTKLIENLGVLTSKTTDKLHEKYKP